MQAAGIAKRRHKQENLDPNAIDLNPALTEIDLQLLTGGRLKANRGPGRSNQLTP